MRRQDFYYELPEPLIAKTPTANRTGSRLLQLNGESGAISHRNFVDLLQLVEPGDLLVFNDTRVIPARVYGSKPTGGQLEVLVERVINSQEVLAHIRSSRSPKPGTEIHLEDQTIVQVIGRSKTLFHLKFPEEKSALEVLENIGHMPLPPYIDREDLAEDRERYQTVYSKKQGAVAAPTAGLHFDDELLEQLKQKGVKQAFVTLHVGAGTFQPVRVDNIRDHHMHSEVMELSPEVCALVKETKASGKRVIAVGTTSVRCLETASNSGEIRPYQGETNIFIYPSYEYKVVDCLLTNFHLPESTLLMLVSAFAGYHNTMQAYKEAVEKEYRFFSYGDAMFINKNTVANQEIVGTDEI